MSTNFGILEWSNEHSQSSYPLSQLFEQNDFIVDASFVQFEGFVPIFKSLSILQRVMTLVLTLDSGDVSVEIIKPSTSYFPGQYVQEIYDVSGERRAGRLVFGGGLPEMFSKHISTALQVNIPFLPSVVRGISKKMGVYSIEGQYGGVNIYTGLSKITQTLFFDIVNNAVTWNAASVPVSINTNPLKTLNGVVPIANAILIDDSDIIKVTPRGDTVLISVAVPIAFNSISPATKYTT